MSCPQPGSRLVVKALDQAQTAWAGQQHDVLPFLVSNENVSRSVTQLAVNTAVLKDAPHVT